jgi:hypothetical protein
MGLDEGGGMILRDASGHERLILAGDLFFGAAPHA